MADEIVSGLSGAGSAPPVKAEEPNFAEAALAKMQKSRAEFDAIAAERNKHYDDLLKSLDSRKNRPFNPMLMKLAAGMLQPTKTGSFGESLGYAAAGMSEQAERDFAQQQQDAKLRFELQSKMSEQKQQELARQASRDILGGVGFEPSLTAPPPSPAVSAAGEAKVMSVEPPVILERGDGTSIAPTQADKEVVFPPTEVAAAPVEKQAPTERKITAGEKAFQAFNKGDAQYRANVKELAPAAYEALMAEEKRRIDAAKAEREERETLTKEQVNIEVGGVKAVMSKAENQRRLDLIDKGDIEGADKIHRKYGLPSYFVKMDNGDYRAKSPAEFVAEAEKAKAESSLEMKDYPIPELGKDVYPMTPGDYAQYRRAKAKGREELNKWLSSNYPEQFGGVQEPIVGSEERKAISAGRVTEQQRLAETRAATRKGYFESAKLADTISRPAKNIYNLASDPIRSKALGLLENPTVGDAFLGVIAQGAAVGSFNVGVPAIRDAVAKLQGATPEEKSKIMDSFQALARNYSELELNFSRMYLENQGQVTEGERKIVRDVSGGLGNRRNIALAQAETLMQRAEFDKTVKSELMAWEKKNPGKSIEDFQESKQYTSLKNSLENNMDKIYDKYFSDSKPKTEPKPELKTEPKSDVKSGMSMADRIAAEKAARGIK